MLKTEITFEALKKTLHTWDLAHSHHKAGWFLGMDSKKMYFKNVDLKLASDEPKVFKEKYSSNP